MSATGWSPLCPANELPSGVARGFAITTVDPPINILVLRLMGSLHAFCNRCPHTGGPLDWTPDQFFDTSGKFLQCATHGALFEPATGRCVVGPCAGDSLQLIEVRAHEGTVEVRVPFDAEQQT